MSSKKEFTQTVLLYDNIFQCPYCHEKLNYLDNSLLCVNKHSFDISKKGVFF